MISLASAIGGLERQDGAWRGTVPDNWLQGRTAYGGFSTALALHAAQHCDTDLPPLRSAQVAFVAPLAGTIDIHATLLRRGRTAAFVQADVASDAGLGVRAMFVFKTPADSKLDHSSGTAPDSLKPGPDAQGVRGIPAIAFTQNFEMIDCPAPANAWLRWIRLADRDGLDPAVALMAIADCLPPAALKLLGGFAPISSMTWQLNLIGDAPQSDDGWHLLSGRSDFAGGGTSSERMSIWNGDGVTVAEHMQSVAVFA